MTAGILALTASLLFAQDYAANSPAAARDLSAVKELYASASYEAALAQLAAIDGAADVTEVEQFRALCLLGLGRTEEAELALERMVRARPLYRIEGSAVSPRLATMFEDVRLRLLPERVKELYATATSSFDEGHWDDAVAEFKMLLSMLDDESLLSASETFADMARVGRGFLKLAEIEVATVVEEQTRAAEARAAATAAAEQPPAEPVIYGAEDSTVMPPVEIERRMPTWNPPTSLAAAGEYRGVLEIVIDEKGRVERASLLRSVAAFYDRPLLEASTTWRFQPATRDGVPVKYRKRLEIVAH